MAACGAKADKAEKKEEEVANPVVTFKCELNDDVKEYCKKNGINLNPADYIQFEAEVYLKQMPYTASNFLGLVNDGYYDGIYFHRIISDFMLQFGCSNTKSYKGEGAYPAGCGQGNPKADSKFTILAGEKKGTEVKRSKPDPSKNDFTGGCIEDEHNASFKQSNEQYTLSMANTGAKHSGGSQFFINTNPKGNAYLDWFRDDLGASKHPVFGKIKKDSQAYINIINGTKTNKGDQPISPLKMKSVTHNCKALFDAVKK